MTGILLVLFKNVNLLLDTARELTQAEGWKEPIAGQGREWRLAGSKIGKFYILYR